LGNQEIICVLGMHRSGTSLLTRILNLIGLNLGPTEILTTEPVAANPKGYWEHSELTLVSDAILKRHGGSWNNPPSLPRNWEANAALDDLKQRAQQIVKKQFAGVPLWGWKDPRTCLTLPFWQRLLPHMRYIICLRNPVAVAHSLARRDRLSSEASSRLWLTYVSSALHYTEGKPRLLVFYEDLMCNGPSELPRLAAFLDVRKRAEQAEVKKAVAEFIEPGMQHFRADGAPAAARSRFEICAGSLYAALRILEHFSRQEINAQEDLDKHLSETLDMLSQYSLR
jgi:hypothetical protein